MFADFMIYFYLHWVEFALVEVCYQPDTMPTKKTTCVIFHEYVFQIIPHEIGWDFYIT